MNSFVLLNTPSVLIIRKPPGIAFHDHDNEKGIVNYTRAQLDLTFESREKIYPVHRIDAITSGALMFARTPEATRELITAFRTRQVQKYYVAVTQRKPAKKMGTVSGDMTKSRRGSWMLQRTSLNPAVTRFLSTAIPGGQPGMRAVLLKPETGKSHQLRVAMKALGAPVLGDSRYANADDARKEDRTYLHCAALRVVVGGVPIQVVCPPTEGVHFMSPGFLDIFQRWFPLGVEDNTGVWFDDNKLLRSTLM